MFDVFYHGPKPNLFEFEKPATSLEDAQRQSKTRYYWYIYGGNDYSQFDFSFVPVPWESDFTHVWPSQWQKNGGTILAPTDVVEHKWHWRDAPVVQRVKPDPIYYMDMFNNESDENFHSIKDKWIDVHKTRYVNDHLTVFKRIVAQCNSEYVWITTSVSDYADFDFTWHPAQWQEEMIHCFPAGIQKRGDTFLLHVESFKRQMVDLELLDWFNVINYCEDQYTNRWPLTAITYTEDKLLSTIRDHEFVGPYALFANQYNEKTSIVLSECLWSPKDRVATRLSTSGAVSILPREIKAHLQTQIYDYPYLSAAKPVLNDYFNAGNFPGLDIVYISNGEPDEQRWYEHACYMSNSNIKWIRGVNGRVAAYQAAARASTTPWFLTVFAKLEVLGNEFPWDWVPDMWQEPKHYIFNARNPVNGLEYGHMGMIAYNKDLVLANNNPGIDFTLSQPHESVPILSGIAHYNQDPWTTWRTAFREVVKLKLFMATQPTLETEHRLYAWFKHNDADYGEWSVRGAQDAKAFYASVGGQYDQLMKSFEWTWLRSYYDAKY
jgi:hypothetical protein